MREVLEGLRGRIGVRGALVMTRDGVVVASELSDGLDPQTVAALASAAVERALKASRVLGLGAAPRVTLQARFGRLVFVPGDETVLVVVTEPHLDLDLTLLEIAGPARRMGELLKLDTAT